MHFTKISLNLCNLVAKGYSMKRFFLLSTLLFSLTLWATPTVTVSIIPQKYFVEQIAKELVTVNVMVGAGASPHTYEPKPAQMKMLANSDAYFSIGDGFEKAWLPRFKSSNPKMLMVDSIKGIQKIAMAEHHHEGEKAGHEEHDEHDELDPHVWLDPMLVKIQAKNIFDALCTLYPLHVKAFEQNYHEFLNSLDALDTTINNTLKEVKNRSFIVFHPSFGYFAARYHLEQIPVEVSGKEVKPNELATIIKEAKEEGANVVFVSPQFSQKSAQIIAKEIGGKILTIDPLSEKWHENMLNIAKVFASELK